MKNVIKILTRLSMLTLSVLLISCEGENSADVNQEKIYTKYEIFYNSNTDKTIVTAQFRFGGPLGTVLELVDAPAEVRFNDELLSYNALYAGHSMEFAGEIPGGTFSYTDLDSNTYINTVPDYTYIGFPMDIDSVSKSEALDINWDGEALQEDETVGVFIGSWKWGDDAGSIQSSVGASNIIVAKNNLASLPLGPSVFYMDRTNEKFLQAGTPEGGTILSKYRAKNIDVQITE